MSKEGTEVTSPYIVPPYEKSGDFFGKRDRTCSQGVPYLMAHVIVFSPLCDRIGQYSEDVVEAHMVVEDPTTDHALKLSVVISQRLEVGSIFPSVRIRHHLSDHLASQPVVASFVDRVYEYRPR